MQLPRKQQTIADSVSVSGFGYWSGQDVTLEFRPAPVDTGIVFVRHDLIPHVRIEADPAHRVEVPRRTTLRHGTTEVEMVEHVMAALTGMQVDNCEIWTNAAEMPGCDGSAKEFVEALVAVGIVEQAAPRQQLVVRETIRLGDDSAWIEARPAPTPRFQVGYRLDYRPHSVIGRQSLDLEITPRSFRESLAESRTFMFKSEADVLRGMGLGQRVTAADLLVFDEDGLIGNELRFDDECVRHKILDVVGDLGMIGCELVGDVVAYRSGHSLNARLAKALLAEGEFQSELQRTA